MNTTIHFYNSQNALPYLVPEKAFFNILQVAQGPTHCHFHWLSSHKGLPLDVLVTPLCSFYGSFSSWLIFLTSLSRWESTGSQAITRKISLPLIRPCHTLILPALSSFQFSNYFLVSNFPVMCLQLPQEMRPRFCLLS